jgi:polyferredoxin
MVVLPLFGTKLPKFGVENKVIYIVLGAVVGGVPVLALISGMSNGLSSSSLGGYGSAGPGLGLWAAIAAGALVLFGAFMGDAGSKPSSHTEVPKE